MAKRFIDTDIFKKGFVKTLSPKYKLLWLYIINDCNHAGIWEVEMDIATLRLGVKYDPVLPKQYEGKVIPIDNDTKWFIPSFLEFQYGELNKANRAHLSVIQILEKHNLIDNKGLIRGLQGRKDMVKDKDKEKGGTGGNDVMLKRAAFEIFWKQYVKQEKEEEAWEEWQKLTPEEIDGELWLQLPLHLAQHRQLKAENRYRYIPQPHTWIKEKRWKNPVDITLKPEVNGKSSAGQTGVNYKPDYHKPFPKKP